MDRRRALPRHVLWANYPAGVLDGYTTRTDENRVVWTDGGHNDGTVRVVGVRKTGDKLEIRVGGTKIDELADAGGYDTTGFDAVGKPAYIGGRPALIQALVGDIAEVMAVKGNVSDAEQSKIESFLKTRYGL